MNPTGSFVNYFTFTICDFLFSAWLISSAHAFVNSLIMSSFCDLNTFTHVMFGSLIKIPPWQITIIYAFSACLNSIYRMIILLIIYHLDLTVIYFGSPALAEAVSSGPQMLMYDKEAKHRNQKIDQRRQNPSYLLFFFNNRGIGEKVEETLAVMPPKEYWNLIDNYSQIRYTNFSDHMVTKVKRRKWPRGYMRKDYNANTFIFGIEYGKTTQYFYGRSFRICWFWLWK